MIPYPSKITMLSNPKTKLRPMTHPTMPSLHSLRFKRSYLASASLPDSVTARMITTIMKSTK
jgi:hypothetical protein